MSYMAYHEQKQAQQAPKPKTNADRIRSMSDEELAYWVMCPHDEPLCGGEPAGGDCMKCCLQWLQQPAEG